MGIRMVLRILPASVYRQGFSLPWVDQAVLLRSVSAYRFISTVLIFLVRICSASREDCLSHAFEGSTPKPQMLIAAANQFDPDWSYLCYMLHITLASCFPIILSLDTKILAVCGRHGYILPFVRNIGKPCHT